MIANLIANAQIHTPPNTRADVEVGSSDARGEPSRSSGSGLGLAIVAAIMESHGGVATLRPTPDGGATFEISLPLAAARGPFEDDSDPSAGRPATDASPM